MLLVSIKPYFSWYSLSVQLMSPSLPFPFAPVAPLMWTSPVDQLQTSFLPSCHHISLGLFMSPTSAAPLCVQLMSPLLPSLPTPLALVVSGVPWTSSLIDQPPTSSFLVVTTSLRCLPSLPNQLPPWWYVGCRCLLLSPVTPAYFLPVCHRSVYKIYAPTRLSPVTFFPTFVLPSCLSQGSIRNINPCWVVTSDSLSNLLPSCLLVLSPPPSCLQALASPSFLFPPNYPISSARHLHQRRPLPTCTLTDLSTTAL